MAVHTLREGCSDSQRLSFLAEALTLGQFDHSHVVRLEGVVTRGRAQSSAREAEMVRQEVGCSCASRPFPQLREGAPKMPSMERKASAFFH